MIFNLDCEVVFGMVSNELFFLNCIILGSFVLLCDCVVVGLIVVFWDVEGEVKFLWFEDGDVLVLFDLFCEEGIVGLYLIFLSLFFYEFYGNVLFFWDDVNGLGFWVVDMNSWVFFEVLIYCIVVVRVVDEDLWVEGLFFCGV